MIFGTDYPVGGLGEDPVTGLFCAITRRYADGTPFHVEQAMAADAALTAYTYNPALALGRGDEMGKIEMGYLADLTILDDDPRLAAAQSLARNRVRAVVIGGAVVKTP